jgi:hypothetical protein
VNPETIMEKTQHDISGGGRITMTASEKLIKEV